MHPLIPDLTGLTMDELNTKYNDLQKKFLLASRSGSGAVLGQMRIVLDEYRNEISRRQQKLLDDLNNKNSAFKNIIDIQ